MRILSILLVLMVSVCAPALAQPQLNAAVNASSFALMGSPNGSLAQGSMATLFGVGMGPNQFAKVSAWPLQTEFQGVSVEITVGGTTVDAIPMIIASSGQITIMIPSNTPVGDGTMVLTYNGQRSNGLSVRIVQNSFGIFAINQAGSGPGVILTTDGSQANLLTNSAAAGQQWDIWGTGLGAVEGEENSGPQPGPFPLDRIKVYVGGIEVTVIYAGRSGCCAAIDQIRIVIPDGLTGCYVPVVVVIDGVPSNFVTMSINNSGPVCSDPGGIPPNILTQQGGASIGEISLTRQTMTIPSSIGTFNSTTDSGFASFERFESAQVNAMAGMPGFFGGNSCLVFTFRADDSEDNPDDPSDIDPVLPAYLDAGNLSVTNSNGMKAIERISKGLYSSTFGSSLPLPGSSPLYLVPGGHTVNGTGGADVGPFSANGTFPGLIDWLNKNDINNITTATPNRLEWSDVGGDTVMIYGTSLDLDGGIGGGFMCRATGTAFTLPGYVVRAMPKSSLQEGVPMGFVGMGTFRSETCSAPGLDSCRLSLNSNDMKGGIMFHGDAVTPPGGGGDPGGGNGNGGGGAFVFGSTAFTPGGPIATKYAATGCGGTNVSPPLTIENIPANTLSLGILIDDPDAGGFVHAAVWDIPPTTTSIPEGGLAAAGVPGTNSAGTVGYFGPCPPPGETHTYRIQIIGIPLSTAGLPAGADATTAGTLLNTFGSFATGIASSTFTFGQ